MTKHTGARDLGGNRPFTPESLQRNSGWVGIPGARHMPNSRDPVFPQFTSIVADWVQAGIEMTDELMQAAVQLATAQAQRAVEKKAIEARQAERVASAAEAVPLPGTFGDAPGGVVYYVRRAQFVKIGTTTQLRGRMRSLMPDEVLAVEPGSYRLEGELHRRFRHIRVRPNLEFFKYTSELRSHIQGVVDRVGPPPDGLSITEALGGATEGASATC